MSKRTVLSVNLPCSKCRKKVMKLIASVEGVTSIALDPAKNTATVVGEADPVKIIKRVRRFRGSAAITSVAAEKKEEKKEEKKVVEKKEEKVVVSYPLRTCQSCDVWYVVRGDGYGYCSIL